MHWFECSSKDIDMVSRLDYNFWAPRESVNKAHITKSIKECAGQDSLITSAFYPSIVPFYQQLENSDPAKCKPFVRVTDARNGLLDFNKTVFLDEDLLYRLSKNIKTVTPGDVVITKGGEYIGEATLVPDYYDEYAICRDILGIRTKDSEVSGEYLTSYLQSEYGKKELLRTRSVQGQPHLTIDKIGELLVPIYDQDFQDDIALHWELFYELIDDSNKHLEQANYIFNNALHNKLEMILSTVSFEEMISVADFSSRFDVDFYERKWTKLVQQLENDGIKFKNIKYIKDSIKPQSPQEMYNYITLSDIDDRSGIVSKLNSMEAYKLPDRAKRKIERGDVLVSSLKGSKEKIAIMDSELKNIVASTGFYVIRDRDFLPEVLYLIFRSQYYDLFIEQMSSGAIMSSITEKYFKKFKVPVIGMDIQKEIAEEITQYINNRILAFQNLNSAINKFNSILSS